MSAGSIDGVITFAAGLPGFETSRRFVLVASPSLRPFTLVQGVDGGAPSFVAIDPRLVDGHYHPSLEPGDLARLGASSADTLLWLALVSAGPDDTATVNLRAPLVVNPVSMCGIQLIATESPYQIDHPLSAE
jgi:flagellar assembly factor FliW